MSHINFILTGRKFPGRRYWTDFADSIVRYAEKMIGESSSQEEIDIIRKTVEINLNEMSCRYKFLGIPLWKINLCQILKPITSTHYISESIVQTALLSKASKGADYMGEKFIGFRDFVLGVEWTCILAARGLQIETSDEIPRINATFHGVKVSNFDKQTKTTKVFNDRENDERLGIIANCQDLIEIEISVHETMLAEEGIVDMGLSADHSIYWYACLSVYGSTILSKNKTNRNYNEECWKSFRQLVSEMIFTRDILMNKNVYRYNDIKVEANSDLFEMEKAIMASEKGDGTYFIEPAAIYLSNKYGANCSKAIMPISALMIIQANSINQKLLPVLDKLNVLFLSK